MSVLFIFAQINVVFDIRDGMSNASGNILRTNNNDMCSRVTVTINTLLWKHACSSQQHTMHTPATWCKKRQNHLSRTKAQINRRKNHLQSQRLKKCNVMAFERMKKSKHCWLNIQPSIRRVYDRLTISRCRAKHWPVCRSANTRSQQIFNSNPLDMHCKGETFWVRLLPGMF